ncbi:MAG: DNA-processing protein DprA [Cytophagaceae bacterium]
MNKNLKVYEVAIGLVPGIGSAITRQLVSYCGSVDEVFKTKKGKLLKIPGIGQHLVDLIANAKFLKEAEAIVEKAEKTGVKLLFYTDKEYPQRLRHIYDAPTLIYYKGNGDLNNKKVISIVGTRKATDYGRAVTERIINDLSSHNTLIVSGLAYGIDITAHKSALSKGLATVGVMASGIDIIYPFVHRPTAEKMQEQGGILTEYTFRTEPEAHRFPSRNRIIAGMCDAVIVVEAAVKGGALITAEIANDYNRDVFAVPGTIVDDLSSGCNNLIKKHKANIYTDIKDLEYLLNWDLNLGEEVKPGKGWDREAFSEEENVILELLSCGDNIQIDDLSWKCQIPLSKLASLLLNLECLGMIKSLPGKKYKMI